MIYLLKRLKDYKNIHGDEIFETHMEEIKSTLDIIESLVIFRVFENNLYVERELAPVFDLTLVEVERFDYLTTIRDYTIKTTDGFFGSDIEKMILIQYNLCMDSCMRMKWIDMKIINGDKDTKRYDKKLADLCHDLTMQNVTHPFI